MVNKNGLLCRAIPSVSRQQRKQKQHTPEQHETCHQGGRKEGGAAKEQPMQYNKPAEKTRRGARRQQRTEREDTPALEGVRTCLSGVQEGDKDHTMMNTSVKEHTAPQQHMKHGVEGKIPTQGQGLCCHET